MRIRSHYVKGLELAAKPTDALGDVKRKIEVARGVPVALQCLYYRPTSRGSYSDPPLLDDDAKTLAEYEIDVEKSFLALGLVLAPYSTALAAATWAGAGPDDRSETRADAVLPSIGGGSRRRRGRDVDRPRTGRGDVAAATWIFRGGRRHRGFESDRLRRSDAQGGTGTYGPGSRLRRGRSDRPRTGRGRSDRPPDRQATRLGDADARVAQKARARAPLHPRGALRAQSDGRREGKIRADP